MTTRVVGTAARKQSDKLLLKLADTAAKRMRLQGEESRLREALQKEEERIRRESRELVLNRQSSLAAPKEKLPQQRAVSAPALKTKAKKTSEAQGPFRETETVDELVDSLKISESVTNRSRWRLR